MSETKELSVLEKAIKIADQAHKGQVRKGNGKPYVTHCEAVAKQVCELTEDEDDELKVVAWLHDVIEDTDITFENLINLGIPQELVEHVWTLTRAEGEGYYDFIMRISDDESGIPAFVKIADLMHNLSDLQPCVLADKYKLALEVLWMNWVDGFGTQTTELTQEEKEQLDAEIKEANSEKEVHNNKA